MKIKEFKKINFQNLAPFYFKKVAGDYLLTNEIGEWLFLTEEEFKKFLRGGYRNDFELYERLREKSFLKKEIDVEALAQRYNKKHSFLFQGPNLHIIVVTLRCNHKCLYCQSSARPVSEKGCDLDKETAQKVVDMIFETTSNFVAIEFQGGEPLLNWPVIKFIVEYAEKKNRKAKKNLEFRLVTTFDSMNEEKLKFLLKNKVHLCTSLDGPEKLHNGQRILSGRNSYQNTLRWIKRISAIYSKSKTKIPQRIDSLLTVTRLSFPYFKKIVDQYLKLGFDNLSLRPLTPIGFSQKTWKRIGYSAEEFINFYKKALNYIIELNLSGKEIKENVAATFLTKILTEGDPNHLDYRSPCGAGIGQLAYNYNGDVYTCDEGRMLSSMGDESFRLGNVSENSYQEIVLSPVVRTLCTSSCLDNLAGCSSCCYKPYCGVCPIYNYITQGNIFAQTKTNERCKTNRAILDILFEKLKDEDIKEIFEKWSKK